MKRTRHNWPSVGETSKLPRAQRPTRRMQVYLTEELYRAVREDAFHRRTTVSAIIRSLLEERRGKGRR